MLTMLLFLALDRSADAAWDRPGGWQPFRSHSAVFVERSKPMHDGRQRISVLRTPAIVTPGDKLVFMLDYRNKGATTATNLVVTNPLPTAVAYQGARTASPRFPSMAGADLGAASPP